jgi:hypothetical protein
MDQGWMRIEIDGGRQSFRPGQQVTGTVEWSLDRDPKSVTLRLFWYTRGKGDRDVEVVREIAFPQPQRAQGARFEIVVPDSPWSFSGKLISLVWALELVADRGSSELERLDLTVSPTGNEIVLHQGDAVAS